MATEAEVREAQKAAKLSWLRPESGISLVGVGFKTRGGVDTGEFALVLGVEKKVPEAQVKSDRDVIPARVHGVPTDVVEVGVIRAFGHFRSRQRPCPGGYSCGHVSITAGTLGAWVRYNGRPAILSNNHVLADSNAGARGDRILQPGRADSGSPLDDVIARLERFVPIIFDGGKKRTSDFLWRAAKWGPNAVARMVGCPRRMQVVSLPQAAPNEVDAALALAVSDQDAIFELRGVRDFQLRDPASKFGRTTDRTAGTVSLVQVTTAVQYGGGRMARFDGQVAVMGSFSAPGDSGSAVLHADGTTLGGLLFAGGSNVTIINRASRVQALLGFTL